MSSHENTSSGDNQEPVEGTFSRFAESQDGEELAWVALADGGGEWQMDAEKAHDLGLKKGDPVVGEIAHPSHEGRRFLRGVRRP